MNSRSKAFWSVQVSGVASAIIALMFSVLSSGCIQDEICNSKARLSKEVDELLSCEETEWVESKGRFYMGSVKPRQRFEQSSAKTEHL